MLSLVLAIGGVALLVWHKRLGQAWYRFHYPFYKPLFGKLFDVDSKWFRRLYNIAVFAAGILLLIGAYALYFGPITL